MARQLDHYHNCQGSGIRSLRDVRAMQRRLRRLDPGRKKSPCLMRSKEAFAYSRSTGYFCSVATDHDATGVEPDGLA